DETTGELDSSEALDLAPLTPEEHDGEPRVGIVPIVRRVPEGAVDERNPCGVGRFVLHLDPVGFGILNRAVRERNRPLRSTIRQFKYANPCSPSARDLAILHGNRDWFRFLGQTSCVDFDAV